MPVVYMSDPAQPEVTPFFDPATHSYSYVLADPNTGTAAIIDAVLDYEPNSGRCKSTSVARILEYVERQGLRVAWVLDTHIHADHLSAGSYLRTQLATPFCIGAEVTQVQSHFSRALHFEPGFCSDGSQFDRLLKDGDRIVLGDLDISVLHTPGHTPACVTYCCGNAAFVGDTLFMPDYGTARTDFPKGDAAALYRSIQKILALPAETRVFVCHDYETKTRTTPQCETSIAAQRAGNIHLAGDIDEAQFIAMRRCRDRQLQTPQLLYPAVQFNIRAGALPPAEANGQRYFKIPVQGA